MMCNFKQFWYIFTIFHALFCYSIETFGLIPAIYVYLAYFTYILNVYHVSQGVCGFGLAGPGILPAERPHGQSPLAESGPGGPGGASLMLRLLLNLHSFRAIAGLPTFWSAKFYPLHRPCYRSEASILNVPSHSVTVRHRHH